MADPIAIVNAETLASSLGAPHTAESVAQVVAWTNALVTDEWRYPEDPVPTRIQMVAYEVAKRALRNPKGLESWSVGHDNTTRTERLPKDAQRAGVYLTSDELVTLQDRPGPSPRRRKFRTIRTRPGY